jgi:hypothetical protein
VTIRQNSCDKPRDISSCFIDVSSYSAHLQCKVVPIQDAENIIWMARTDLKAFTDEFYITSINKVGYKLKLIPLKSLYRK